MRCSVDWNNQSVVSVVAQEKIEMVRLGLGDDLPELAVDGYKFKDVTVAAALNKLLDGTDVSVVVDEQLVFLFSVLLWFCVGFFHVRYSLPLLWY